MRRLIVALLSVIPVLIFALPASAAPAHRTAAPRTDLAPSQHPLLAAVAASGQIRAKPGSSLSSLAAKTLGSSKVWPVLWWDNRSAVPNPNDVPAGTRLHYGSWDYVRPWLRHRALAAIPKPAPAARAATESSGGGAVPSAPAITGGAFEQCVIMRESGGNPAAYNPSSGAGGLFQFLPSTWASLGFAASYPGGAQTAPASVQYAAFDKLYAEAGTAPWRPYDGC